MAEQVSAAVVVKRCNPFGHGTDAGPKHLMGGLYGPEYEGRLKWECRNPAEVRCRMECRCGHRGQVMDLCREHPAMIAKRMAGTCPACVMPPAARELFEAVTRAQGTVVNLIATGGAPAAVQAALSRAERLGEDMNVLVLRGQAGDLTCPHNCPLTVTEVS